MGQSLPSFYSTKANGKTWNNEEDDYQKKSIEMWNNEVAVESCGMKVATAIDRMGQGVVGECFDFCEMTTGKKQEYMKLSPDNSKEQILISKGSIDNGKTLAEMLGLVSGNIAAPTTWLVRIDDHPENKREYLKLAKESKTAQDRIFYIGLAIRASEDIRNPDEDDNAAVPKVRIARTQSCGGAEGVVARNLGLDDIIFSLNEGQSNTKLTLSDAEIYHELGLTLLGVDQSLSPLAIKAFKVAHFLNPKEVGYIISVGQALMTQKRFSEAEHELEAGCRLFPYSSMLRFQMGIAIVGDSKSQENLERSLQYLNEAMRLDPNNQEYHSTTGSTMEILSTFHGSQNRSALLTEALQYHKRALAIHSSPQARRSVERLEQIVSFSPAACEISHE